MYSPIARRSDVCPTKIILPRHSSFIERTNRSGYAFKLGDIGGNRIWVGDMTFIRTRAGFLDLAVLLDLYARNVVGWSMHDRPNLEVTLRALDMALAHRRPAPGLVHHTDQAPLYSAHAYRKRMRAHGMLPSMSARGDCYDNAVAESFFSNLKNELVHHCDFASRVAARAAIFDYIEVFYNRQRRHQTLGYVSPMQFEQQKKGS